MCDWQSIVTAPRDGTEIDLWVKGHSGDEWRATDFSWTDERSWGHRGDPSDSLDQYFLGSPVVATHWMPKPQPPSRD
jgi:hypothetical protein